MGPQDLAAADRVFRVAFGTYIGLPDPAQFAAGADYVRTRHTDDPASAFVAEHGGEVIGSNFATNWGSVGFFGPLTVRPDHWDHGVGAQLMTPVMECFERWDTQLAGLYTFANSAKHVGLYQKFGFWPRYLTALMAKPVQRPERVPEYTTLSSLGSAEREEMIAGCRELTDSIYERLDVTGEIRAVEQQRLGDVLLLRERSKLVAFAVCHCGPGTEAGPDSCYAKFAAARPATRSSPAGHLESLLAAWEDFAQSQGLGHIKGGVNAGRTEAYAAMREYGFRTLVQGVAMHRPNEPGYSRPGCLVLDDWR